tara:strand:- start:849 stop:2228 length:1380 start_codon:yes stop_codon:yes gene_type:complete
VFKLIIFDLDGVLYDSKAYHFDALNLALGEISEEFSIPFEEHVKKYDGLPTYKKLEMLTLDKGLDEKHYEDIWNNKQKYTLDLLKNIEKDDDLISLFDSFKSSDISLALASNSISRTVYSVIENLGVKEFFDVIVSNEDVKNSKPHPEMYWKCMSKLSIKPNETLIIEDSPVGRLGASMSGANTYFVKSRSEVNSNLYNYVIEFDDKEVMNKLNQYVDKKLNILIPMAGKGSRFSEKGYVFPKPLIEIKGKPMIQVVVENINIDANYIFIVQKEHVDKYNIDKMLKLLKPDCKIVVLDDVTEGAASTTLMAKNYIDNESPLLIANSDQFIEWNPRESMYKFSSDDISGGILTFNATHPKWSYAKLNELGEVIEVAEKNPISNNATVGIYYWKSGSEYVSCAEEMIDKNIRVNNEFYVCPVYNQAIEREYKIVTSPIKKMWGIGTPEDLDSFLSEYQGSI